MGIYSMETSASEPNCSLISLDNSPEKHNLTLEDLNINTINLENNNNTNQQNNNINPQNNNINLENNNIENQTPDHWDRWWNHESIRIPRCSDIAGAFRLDVK